MSLKLNQCIIVLGAFFITTLALAQSSQDSTNLPKMQQRDFKAMEKDESVTVLTKTNLKETFKGLQVTVNNSGDYVRYHEDLRYKVVEQAGKLAIQRYTPKMTCPTWINRPGRELCLADDRKLGGRTSIVCTFSEGTKSCKSSNGSYYELTLSGLLMGESYASCWRVPEPIVNFRTVCGYRQFIQRVYLWEEPPATP